MRVFCVARDSESRVHDVVDYNATILAEGAVETTVGAHRFPFFLRRQSHTEISLVPQASGLMSPAIRKAEIAS